MNLTLKTPSYPSVLSEWINQDPLFMSNFFNLDNDFVIPKLGVTLPGVNIRENPKEFVFELAAPGLQRKDFKIELDNHILKISAERDEAKEEKEENFFRKEYSFTSFVRSFSLPDTVDESQIDARYQDGILKLTVPKIKESIAPPRKKISVG